MKVIEIISLLGSLAEEYSKDTKFTEQKLWTTFSIAKAKLQSKKLGRFKVISPRQYKTVCLKLEEGLSHNCGCVTVGCTVYKSVYQLPDYISGDTIDGLRIFSVLNGKQIGYIDESEYLDLQDDDIYKDEISYSIVNGYLIIWNKSTDYVQVRALWADNTQLNDIQDCEGNLANCIDYYNEDTGLSQEQVYDAIAETFRLLKIPMETIEDSTNDINPDIRA